MPLPTKDSSTRTGLSRRQALAAVMALPLQYQPKLGKGWLTIDLNQWTGITVKHGTRELHFTAADVFAALEER